jgi:hypothetical protein
MSAFEIERSQKIHCQELNTGRNYTGQLFVSEKEIYVDLFGYDEGFFIEAENGPVFLRTKNNSFVSLHLNMESAGHNFRDGKQRLVVHHQKIISSLAVVGPDRWTENDKLKNVTFALKQTERLLRHRDKTDRLGLRVGDDNAFQLFSVHIGSIKVGAGYQCSFGIDHDRPLEISPYLEIEFDGGVSLPAYLEYVSCVAKFFSAALGIPLTPNNIRISRLSREEMLEAINKDEFYGAHSVEYIWPPSKRDETDLWLGRSFILAYDDKELSALEACLVVWVDRLPLWKKAYALMMSSLSLRGEISPYRLLTAWRWFEQIPGNEPNARITEEHTSVISRVASNKAVELGYSDIENRVAGSLKRIGTESNSERFARLVDKVRKKFGYGVFDDEICTHLERSVALRGMAAHGHPTAEGDAEFKQFAKSTLAVEALSYLLTLLDLPIGAEGIARAGMNRLVEDYRHCH